MLLNDPALCSSSAAVQRSGVGDMQRAPILAAEFFFVIFPESGQTCRRRPWHNRRPRTGKTAGGVVNAVTRNGGNHLHGDVYEFLRNSALDARNEFDQVGRIAPFRQNLFGTSAGGPIVRDRTFVFGNYEGLRQYRSTNASSTVPSASARSGQVDPNVAPYLQFYPLPNPTVSGDTGDTGTFLFNDPAVVHENYFTVRADHKISSTDQLAGTYFFDSGTLVSPDPFDVKVSGNIDKRQMASINESHIFTPTLLNTARLGCSRVVSDAPTTLNAILPAAADPSLGFVPGLPVGLINIGGLSNFTGGLHAVGEFVFHYNSYQAYEDIYWIHGKHALKAGFSLERLQNNQLGTANPNGQFRFDSLAGFLTNKPTRFNAPLGQTTSPKDLRQSVYGAYITNDYHAAKNLTFNVGLRYELATVPTETAGRLANLPTLSVWPHRTSVRHTFPTPRKKASLHGSDSPGTPSIPVKPPCMAATASTTPCHSTISSRD
jgi:hypothetical protein